MPGARPRSISIFVDCTRAALGGIPNWRERRGQEQIESALRRFSRGPKSGWRAKKRPVQPSSTPPVALATLTPATLAIAVFARAAALIPPLSPPPLSPPRLSPPQLSPLPLSPSSRRLHSSRLHCSHFRRSVASIHPRRAVLSPACLPARPPLAAPPPSRLASSPQPPSPSPPLPPSPSPPLPKICFVRSLYSLDRGPRCRYVRSSVVSQARRAVENQVPRSRLRASRRTAERAASKYHAMPALFSARSEYRSPSRNANNMVGTEGMRSPGNIPRTFGALYSDTHPPPSPEFRAHGDYALSTTALLIPLQAQD